MRCCGELILVQRDGRFKQASRLRMCEATTTAYVFYSGRKQVGENYCYCRVFDVRWLRWLRWRLERGRPGRLQITDSTWDDGWLKNIFLPQVCSALGSCASSRTYSMHSPVYSHITTGLD